MTRYVLHPGYIISRTDGQRHFIGAGQLRKLYLLSENDHVIVLHEGWRDCAYHPQPEDIHCRPRYNGDYPFFEDR